MPSFVMPSTKWMPPMRSTAIAVDHALRRTFLYLNDLGKQLNVVQMPSPFVFGLPTVGNIAENIVGIKIAYENKMDFSMVVSLGSSLQVALGVEQKGAHPPAGRAR